MNSVLLFYYVSGSACSGFKACTCHCMNCMCTTLLFHTLSCALSADSCSSICWCVVLRWSVSSCSAATMPFSCVCRAPLAWRSSRTEALQTHTTRNQQCSSNQVKVVAANLRTLHTIRAGMGLLEGSSNRHVAHAVRRCFSGSQDCLVCTYFCSSSCSCSS